MTGSTVKYLSEDDVYSAMDELKNGFAIYDKDLNLIFANQAARSFLPTLYGNLDAGITMQESLAAQVHDFYPDLDTEACEIRAEEIFQRILNESTMEVIADQGRKINSVYKKMKNGQYVLISTDITDRVKIERAIEQAAQDAQDANQAKTEFLANMSHEIRTPLSGVFMAAQLLQQQLRLSNQSELSSLADILVGSANHLSAIINDVLDLSKIEAGQIDLDFTENSLSETLRLFKKAQDNVARNIGIDLKLRLDPNLPERLIYDSVRVRQCVTNLVSNALKFTDTGSVTIAVLFDPKTEIVTVHVADTGIGIAPEEQAHVFDHFAQVKLETTNSNMGTGLGLAISRKLARLMGGDIKLTSELNKGSIFTLTFATQPIASIAQKLSA